MLAELHRKKQKKGKIELEDLPRVLLMGRSILTKFNGNPMAHEARMIRLRKTKCGVSITALAFTVIISLSTTQVFASLLAVDYVAGSGDKGLTFDSSSNLEWLDLTLTKGKSVYQVEAGFGGYIANGF